MRLSSQIATSLFRPQRAGERRGFVRDAFHQAAVAHEHPGAVVDDGEFGPVEALRQQFFGERHADGVGEALAERPGRGFHARRHEVFRMARRLRIELAEVLELVHRQVVAGQVQQRVLQHRAVAVGQDEAVAVEPLRVVRVVVEVIVPEHLGDVRHAHRHARMAGLRGLDRIDGEETDGVGEVAAAGLAGSRRRHEHRSREAARANRGRWLLSHPPRPVAALLRTETGDRRCPIRPAGVTRR